jgi:hypothetical protein
MTMDGVLGHLGTGSVTRRVTESASADPLRPFRAEAERAWGDPFDDRTVAWPFSLRVGRVGPRSTGS